MVPARYQKTLKNVKHSLKSRVWAFAVIRKKPDKCAWDPGNLLIRFFNYFWIILGSILASKIEEKWPTNPVRFGVSFWEALNQLPMAISWGSTSPQDTLSGYPNRRWNLRFERNGRNRGKEDQCCLSYTPWARGPANLTCFIVFACLSFTRCCFTQLHTEHSSTV